MFSELRKLFTYFGVLERAPQTEPIEPFERWHDYGPGTGVRIFRPVVYTMEQHVLPQAFFQDHPSIARATAGNSRISKELSDLWFFSFRRCVEAGSVPRNSDINGLPVLRYLSDLAACTTTSRHQEAGLAASVVTLPVPLKSGDAYFIALCTAGNDSGAIRRCFTLEKSTEDGVAYFCELLASGGRANLGPTPLLSREEFANKSLSRLRAIGA